MEARVLACLQITDSGAEQRSKIEDLTDELAYAQWRTLPDDEATELVALATLIRDAVQAAGVFPSGAFGRASANTVSLNTVYLR